MRSLIRIVFIPFLALFSAQASAIPVIHDSAYNIELLTTVSGSALHAMDFDSSGNLYISSYNNGNVFVINSPASGQQTATLFSSGFSYANGLTVTDDGRLFVSTGLGNIYQIYSDGTSSLFSSGYSYSTEIDSYSNDLFISNSGDGTISKVDGSTGIGSVFLSGFSTPNGPFGLSIGDDGMLYFSDHLTGSAFSSDQSGNVSLLGSFTPFGVGYTGVNAAGDVFVSDILSREIYKIDSLGNIDVFASGFTGKDNPPFNGPHDIVFDDLGYMYITDAETIWRVVTVSEPYTVTIDIKPSKKSTNIIDFNKDKYLKVAVVGDTTFDALQVDPTTVKFGPNEASPIRFNVKDYNRDGFFDLILTFKLKDTGITCGDTAATLTGELYDGTLIAGADSFQTTNCQ
ncbi:MAG: hypothetical protein ABFR65_00945 [Pseudomonadota bacterium]